MSLYLTKSCSCEIKDHNNWIITEPTRGKTAIVRCDKCHNQWRTSANYVSELKFASYITKDGRNIKHKAVKTMPNTASYTKEEIMNIPAGRELDRLIAEKVFNGEVNTLNYSTDINDAMEIARKFIPNFTLNYLDNKLFPIGWHCNINDHHVSGCKTPTQAICRAALLAVMEDN